MSELDHNPAWTAQPGDRPNKGLAAAIAEIKELYERESEGLTEPIEAAERDHQDLPRQQADNPEPEWDAERREVNGAQARSARAVAALASEHEKRLAAEAELDRLRAEVEGERERTREALQQAQAADERAERAEAELKRFCREVEVWHHQTEQEFARLGEEANGLGQRLQAAEAEAAQVRQAVPVRQSFKGLRRISRATWAVLAVAAVVVGGGVLYFWVAPADSNLASVLMPVQRTWDAAEQTIFGGKPDLEAEKKRAAITPVPGSAALIGKTEQPQAHTITATESGSGPEASPDRQQPAIATLPHDGLPERKSAVPGSVSADVVSQAEHNQSQALNVAQVTRAEIEALRPKVPPIDNETTSSAGLTIPRPSGEPTPLTSPSKDETVPGVPPATDAVVAQLSIHYRQGSTSARTDAERLAKWFASSGFGTSQLLRTQQAVREPVVRYFYMADAATATRIVEELRKGGGNWRVEDCTHYRHKPPIGAIQIWPTQ